MNSASNHFGLMVAYLLPGFIGLAGIVPFAPMVAAWLQPLDQQASLGPPVYAVLAATTVGMILSCFRWVLIDHVHQWTGVRPPVWDDRLLEDRVDAFNYLVDNHYRYYQFFANTLIAVLVAYSVNRFMNTLPLFGFASDVVVCVLCAALFAGSRDSLAKYYARTSQLMGQLLKKGSSPMTNGNQHDGGSAQAATPRPEAKPMKGPTQQPKPLQKPAQTRR